MVVEINGDGVRTGAFCSRSTAVTDFDP